MTEVSGDGLEAVALGPVSWDDAFVLVVGAGGLQDAMGAAQPGQDPRVVQAMCRSDDTAGTVISIF
ncbi:MAG: hypothetical protein NVS3B26_07130 [Mycobacteriales bacterium]